MKIGILIKKFARLRNWELRIIQEIIDNPELELALLIQDGRPSAQSKTALGEIPFKAQTFIERKFFFKELFFCRI